MSRPKKDRPDFDGGFLKLQRRLFPFLRLEKGLTPELSFFYIQLLAAARFTQYPGTLGWVGNPWSFRDIAACCFVEYTTARRNVHILRDAGLIKWCRAPNGRMIWQITEYGARIADDEDDE